MLTKTEKNFSIVFLLIVLIDIICDNTSSLASFHYITKPAILSSLIVFFLKNSNHLATKTKTLMVLALSFSLLGDISLIFVDRSSNFFITGLVSFLVAHVMYILIFLKSRNKDKSPWLFVLLLALYAFGMFHFLNNGLGSMLVPVVIYMSVILFMATTAFLRLGSVPIASYNLVFIGAILFMISDSLLALNKFYQPLLYANFSIIFTYALAQLFIVLGLIKQS